MGLLRQGVQFFGLLLLSLWGSAAAAASSPSSSSSSSSSSGGFVARAHRSVAADVSRRFGARPQSFPARFDTLSSRPFVSLREAVHGRRVPDSVQFEALGQRFDIRLEHDTELFGDLSPTDGARALDHSAYFLGSLRNAAAFRVAPGTPRGLSSIVQLRIMKTGEVRGIIFVPGNDTYVFDSAPRHFSTERRRQESMGDVVVFSHGDLAALRAKMGAPQKACGHAAHHVSGQQEKQPQQPVGKAGESAAAAASGVSRSLGRRQTVQACSIALVADSKFTSWLGNSYQATHEMVDIIAGANAKYRAQNLVGLRIVSTLVYPNAGSDPFLATSGTVSGFLGQVEALKASIAPADKCAVHGFTFEDYTPTVGQAYLSAACQANGGAGVTSHESFTPQALSESIIVAAHELGHNYGADHDASGNDIMAASGASGGSGVFSAGSVATISAFQAAQTCFQAGGSPSTALCGNGIVETGEDCDCGGPCASVDIACNDECALEAGFNCSTAGNPCCDPATHHFRPNSFVCGTTPYQLSWLDAPRCTGGSPECPDCWPSEEGHPCWRFSNLIPCDGGGTGCDAFCSNDGGTTCSPAASFGVTTNIPDGVCCTGCSNPPCRCDGSGACNDCQPANCGLAECGTVSDGCGSSVTCGTCPNNLVCMGGLCVLDIGVPPGSEIPPVDEVASEAQNWWQEQELWVQLVIIFAAVLCCCFCVCLLFGGEKKRRGTRKNPYY